MNKRNGFTLVEMLTVAIILGVISVIIIPIIDSLLKESRQTAYQTQVNAIKTAAEDWSSHNPEHLPTTSGTTTTVELRTLKQDGYVSMKLTNPLTRTYFYDNTFVVIKKYYDNYTYEVTVTEEPDEYDQVYSESYELVPTITLNNVLPTVAIAIGSTYTVSSTDVTATAKGEKTITNIEVVIKKNGLVVGSINTASAATYIISYRAIDSDNLSSTIERVVIVS